MALSLLITFLFSDNGRSFPNELFSPSHDTLSWNFFAIMGHNNLTLSVVIACVILLWVISGYLPQLSCLLHAWIAISYFNVALVIEGGDQIAQILSIFIIPIAITDPRLNHWYAPDQTFFKRPGFFLRYFAYSSALIIQLQMSLLYFFAFVDKFGVDEWRNGTAFYYWFNHTPFGADDWLRSLFGWVVADPFLGRVLDWGVLALEAALFAAIFMEQKKKRRMLYAAIIFHFAIILVHGLGSFFFAMTAGLILYLHPVDHEFSWSAIVDSIKGLRTKNPTLLMTNKLSRILSRSNQ
ncbi:hypothetical protein LVD15_23325 [Fulvivirga maritima]|uniref:hypothetical protein n=1 Tax=Fulvivirga maritima TaxID=2904247 RepID=UPI001F45BD1C|nr:hypothetical protein [Fulvivirga maritima]UII26201.1 hypothetical protein LVD15_23325 [Fulvivirga maritima]